MNLCNAASSALYQERLAHSGCIRRDVCRAWLMYFLIKSKPVAAPSSNHITGGRKYKYGTQLSVYSIALYTLRTRSAWSNERRACDRRSRTCRFHPTGACVGLRSAHTQQRKAEPAARASLAAHLAMRSAIRHRDGATGKLTKSVTRSRVGSQRSAVRPSASARGG